jgi:hypothetical protein
MRIGPSVLLIAVSGSRFVESSPRSFALSVTAKGTREAVGAAGNPGSVIGPGFPPNVRTPSSDTWSGLVVARL